MSFRDDDAAAAPEAPTEGGVMVGGGAGTRRPGAPTRCLWCGRQLPDPSGTGRRRKYCGQSCRQRAYEERSALARRDLPADAVVLTAAERDDLADRLYQMSCAAEDVATALAEGASPAEMASLVDHLVLAARAAERIR